MLHLLAYADYAGVSYEDLGGPTPENYRPDDDSAKLKDPSGEGGHAKNLKSVRALSKEELRLKRPKSSSKTRHRRGSRRGDSRRDCCEELPEITDDVDVEEDVNALLGGQELSEEFRDKQDYFRSA